MKLYETWQEAGRTLRAERDERAEQAWLRVERLVLRTAVPAVAAAYLVLVAVPMPGHLRTRLIAPIALLVLVAVLTACVIGMRRYRPDTPAAKAAGAIRMMIVLPLAGVMFFGLSWATSDDHRIVAAVTSAVFWVIGMLAYYAWLWRRSREQDRGEARRLRSCRSVLPRGAVGPCGGDDELDDRIQRDSGGVDHQEKDAPLRGAMPGMKLGAGRGLRVVCRGFAGWGWAEGACWVWRAVRRHRFTLDRSRP